MKKNILFLGVIGAMISCGAVAQQDSSRFYAGAGYGVVSIAEEEGISFSDANNGFIQLGYKITENFAIEGQYSKSTKDASADFPTTDLDVSEIWWETMVELNPGMTMSEAQSYFPYAQAEIDMNIDASIETTAIYGVYRSSGNVYVKAKAGYLKEEATFTSKINSLDFYVVDSNYQETEFSLAKGDEGFEDFSREAQISVSESESGFSAGLGAGYKFNDRFFSELEYTMVSEDLDMYSLSINYAF